MQLVERYVINKKNKNYLEIDNLSFLSKNLYNMANYMLRQEFINNSRYLNYNAVQKLLQNQVDYQALPAKVSQQVLMLLSKNWKSFSSAIKAYQKDPSKFLGRPKLPKYKHKTKGRNILVYTIQAVSQPALRKKQIIKLSQTHVEIKTRVKYEELAQVRIVPKLNHYIVEVVYEKASRDMGLNKSNIAGIDLGVNNLATLTSNKKGFKPLVINGRPLKSINQYFNKNQAKLKSYIKKGTTKRIQNLSTKRNFKADDYLHKASRLIVDKLIQNHIGTLVIGKNSGWKQEINIGKINTQNFVQIPYERFIHQLKYKAELVGINVIITEESYTSKASFLRFRCNPNL